ncbi:MAG: GLUG motif-containing protein [Planctomycetota bacterium]|jgi:hypothetical protein
MRAKRKSLKNIVIFSFFIFIFSLPCFSSEPIEISVQTDKEVYYEDEFIGIIVTAFNPNSESVTLGFGSSCQSTYIMDATYEPGLGCLTVVTEVTIEPFSYVTWIDVYDYEMSEYPLEIGIHCVTGEVIGYGFSDPVFFSVISESDPNLPLEDKYKYSCGNGSSERPFRISAPEDLNEISSYPEDFDKDFILVNDINMADYTYSTAIIAPDTVNPGRPFNGTLFTGVFDGSDHVIRNLTIDTAEADNWYLGLFGFIYEGTIKNLGIEDYNIIGGDNSDYIGGLSGYNGYGTIANCYSTGSVTGGDFSNSLGGLCGFDFEGTFSDCYAAGSVSGYGSIGGLIGKSMFGGNILNCYADVDITGKIYLGGLCGYHLWGMISNCYASGSVTGSDDSQWLGGLCGRSGGIIKNCYSTGSVTGGDHSKSLGGLCGEGGWIIENCFSTGSVTAGDHSEYLGGLCGESGWIGGIIENCYSTGSVTAGDDSEYLGGLCGVHYGGIIENSYSIGSVVGNNSFIGGLCGFNDYGTIINCYSTISVMGRDYLGGLCGGSNGTIINSYARGSVRGGSFTGGLCGKNWGVISNCYASGYVFGHHHSTGALIGHSDLAIGEFWNTFEMHQDCFYDSDINPHINGIGNLDYANVIGLPTSEMQIRSPFTDAGWDFVFETDNGTEDIWMIHEHHDYPKFTYQNILPIAVPGPNQTVGIWPGNGYAEVLLDGLNSYDPDGDSNNLTYQWSWTIDSNDCNSTEPIFLTDLPVGLHTFELVVSDGIDDSEPNTCDITIIAPLRTEAMIVPKTLNRKAKGPKQIRVFMNIPAGIQKEDIVDDSLLLHHTGSGFLLQASNQIIVKSRKGTLRCLVSFNRDDLLDAIDDNGQIVLNVLAQLKTGQYIYGTDTINIK